MFEYQVARKTSGIVKGEFKSAGRHDERLEKAGGKGPK